MTRACDGTPSLRAGLQLRLQLLARTPLFAYRTESQFLNAEGGTLSWRSRQRLCCMSLAKPIPGSSLARSHSPRSVKTPGAQYVPSGHTSCFCSSAPGHQVVPDLSSPPVAKTQRRKRLRHDCSVAGERVHGLRRSLPWKRNPQKRTSALRCILRDRISIFGMQMSCNSPCVMKQLQLSVRT